jgi:hypothetical protein
MLLILAGIFDNLIFPAEGRKNAFCQKKPEKLENRMRFDILADKNLN